MAWLGCIIGILECEWMDSSDVVRCAMMYLRMYDGCMSPLQIKDGKQIKCLQ